MTPSKKTTLGLALLTKNEAHVLEKCIKSVPFADEISLVDAESTDASVETAKRLGAQVFVRKDTGVRDLKQFIIEQVKTDWVLVLDPDEWLTEDCQKEIQAIIGHGTEFSGFEIPRQNLFLNKPIKYGRGIDHPLRLFKHGVAKYTPTAPHERIIVEGNVGRLKAGMFHDTTPTVNARLRKIIYETDLELTHPPDKPPTLKQLFLDPLIYFTSFVIKQGAWRDGVPGLIQMGLFSVEIFVRNAKLYELHTFNKNKK